MFAICYEYSMSNFISVDGWFICVILSSQSWPTLCDPMNCSSPGSSVHGDSPGKNTGMGCHDLLQGISPTQGSNPGLLHCRQTVYFLSHQRNPRILEWLAYRFSRGPFPNQELNRVSCIAGGFFTSWANKEALIYLWFFQILTPFLLRIPSIFNFDVIQNLYQKCKNSKRNSPLKFDHCSYFDFTLFCFIILSQYIYIQSSLAMPRRRKWQHTPVFLPGESCGQRSLVGCCL